MCDTPEPRNLRPRRRWIKYLYKGIAGLGLVITVTLISLNLAGRYSFRRAVAEARALGQPVTFEEIIAARPTCPPDQDAGLHFMRIRDRLNSLDNDKVLPLISEELPPLGQLWTREQMTAVQTQLARVAAEIREINKLKDFPSGGLPFTQPAAFEDLVKMTSLSDLRFSCQLKYLDMLARVMAGDLSTVQDDLLILRRHGQLVHDHPFLISALVGIALDSHTVSAVEHALALGVFKPDALAGIEAGLPDPPQSLYWGLLGERAAMGLSLEPLGRVAKWHWAGWLRLDRAAGFSAMTQLAEAARNSPTPLPVARQIIGSQRQCYVLTNALLPSLERSFALSSRNIAQVRAARVGLAVERYRLAEGQFPKDLSQLTPAYLREIPQDPFANAPLRYALTETGAVIYSVGEDEVDDHGNLGPTPSGKVGPDFGFRVLRPELRRLPAVSTQPTDTATQTH